MNKKGHASRKRFIWIFTISLMFIGAAGAVLYFIGRHPISITKETEWAIDIYEGASHLMLSPASGISHPVLRKSDVTDIKADFVADPFFVRSADDWYMFFEVMNALTGQGDIGCATSQDGLRWKYERIVLDEPYHLSYPYVFQWEGQFYMIPESAKAGAIRLYRAEGFPYLWTFVSNLIEGSYSDTSIFFVDKTWWMFTCSKPFTHDELRLFYAENLLGPWAEHPASPVVRGNPSKAQCGGRIIIANNTITRFTHDDFPTYGKKVNASLITEISRTQYSEEEYKGNPVLGAQGKGWNRHGMHHIDAHEIRQGKWIAAVDGYRKHLVVKIEY